MVTEKDLEAELAEIGTRIEKLRVRYQGFFLGLDKQPPLFERDQMERMLRLSVLNDARRAIFKFRFQALIQRYRTMAVYWDRIMRELEEGKTSRETLRREAGYATGSPSEREARAVAAAAGGTGATPPVPEDTPADPTRRLYDAYLTARSSLGMSNEGITEAAFRAGLEKQRKAQSERLGVPDVTFSVLVKEGRVVLMARPVAEPAGT